MRYNIFIRKKYFLYFFGDNKKQSFPEKFDSGNKEEMPKNKDFSKEKDPETN